MPILLNAVATILVATSAVSPLSMSQELADTTQQCNDVLLRDFKEQPDVLWLAKNLEALRKKALVTASPGDQDNYKAASDAAMTMAHAHALQVGACKTVARLAAELRTQTESER